MFRPLFLVALAGFTLFLIGCADSSQQSLGEAYVAPASLNVRSQLSQKSSSVVMVKHGEAVAVVDMVRRMVKVRTRSGFEGWVDSRDLLSREQMQELRHEREEQARLPAQGTATAFEALNIHIAPSRSAAAFTQIPEGGAVTILGRRIAPKVAPAAKTPLLVPDKPAAPARRSRKEQAAKQSFRLPPKPKPPKAPENWQALSTERIGGESEKIPVPLPSVEKKPAPAKPIVMEDWTLIRTKTNETGWVLSRNLLMSIPDEVAQYAEGKHITAFFELGQVNDTEKGVKHHWLWTTLSGPLPYDFDSWRVFLWNGRRHRYETSYRKRDLEGYFPVHVDPAGADKTRTFQMITKDDDGKLRKRSYVFDGTLVRLTGTEDYSASEAGRAPASKGLDGGNLQPKPRQPGWFRRQWNSLKQRLGRG